MKMSSYFRPRELGDVDVVNYLVGFIFFCIHSRMKPQLKSLVFILLVMPHRKKTNERS